MVSEAIARQAAMIRQIVAFVYRLIARMRGDFWKLTVPRPPPIQVQGIPGTPRWLLAYSPYETRVGSIWDPNPG